MSWSASKSGKASSQQAWFQRKFFSYTPLQSILPVVRSLLVTRHQPSLPSSRLLSHALETSFGSETSCQKLRCCNVEPDGCNASSAADVWNTCRWHGVQTFALKTQRQPGSCPTDRTRWCEEETEALRLTARGCTPRWLNNVLQPEM